MKGPVVPFSDDARLVERPGPGLAPTAFRIWAAGENMTDFGPHYFTRDSADMLMSAQQRRGNIYSFDYDHLSFETNRPADAGRAAGWHTIETRPDENGEPELWATNAEWCSVAKSGLEATPPEWRFFSPAYGLDEETGEIVSYSNSALCINPATHNNTQLAIRATQGSNSRSLMNLTKAQRETLAVLNAMHASANAADGTPETKAAAGAMYAAHGGAEMHDTLKAAAAAEEAPKDDPAPDSDEAPATSRSAGATKAAATEQAAAGTPATAAAVAAVAATANPADLAFAKETAARMEVIAREVAAMRADRRAADLERVLATRKDVTPQLRASLRKHGSPTYAKEVLDGIPRPDVKTAAPAPGAGTRVAPGAGASPADERDPAARESVRRALNLHVPPEKVGWSKPQNGLHVLTSMTPAEARARAAGKKAS